MTEKQLRKLQRMELLEILLDQREKIDALEKELAETKAALESRKIKEAESGNIAEASLALTKVFEEAQKAADLFLENVKANALGADPDVVYAARTETLEADSDKEAEDAGTAD